MRLIRRTTSIRLFGRIVLVALVEAAGLAAVLRPRPAADPAKVVLALGAAHVVAALVLLDARGALWALFRVEQDPVGRLALVAALFEPRVEARARDGRVRLAHTAIGYAEKWIDSKNDTYFNGARASLEAFKTLIDDARAGKQIKG